MTTVDIGVTTAKVRIYDNATEASSKYRWYLTGSMHFSDPQQKEGELAGIGGQTSISDAYTVTDKYSFSEVNIIDETDWNKLKQAFAYWRANNTKLYLAIVPDGWTSTSNSITPAGNMATYIQKANNSDANAGAQTQFTGKVKNFRVGMNGAGLLASFDLVYCNV